MGTNDASFNDGTGIANNAITSVLLDAVESTDFQNGTALTINTWTDFKGNQNFTVASTSSIILIFISAGAIVGSTAATASASKAIIDSAGTPITKYLGSTWQLGAGGYGNPFSGAQPIVLTGLSAGTHTIKTQVIASTASNGMYCRASSSPNFEFYSTRIVEIKK